MYRNLNVAALGISGRQSELIELALTYGFRGIDLDMADIVKRVRSRGLEHASRFILSAKIKVGGFDLPIHLEGDETTFRSTVVELKEIAEMAQSLGAESCNMTILPANDDLPYHENFELHRTRLAEMGDVLAAYGIKLGIMFQAAPEHRADHTYEFIHQAESLLTLIKTAGSPNVGLTLDTWNWHIGGGAMDQLSDLAVAQIAHVRLADVPADVDLANITELDRDLPRTDGPANCVAVIQHLGQIGYDGPVTLRPHPSKLSGMTRDAIVQKAAATFDELWRQAGLNRAGKMEAAPVVAE